MVSLALIPSVDHSFKKILITIGPVQGRKGMFYLMMHSAHFNYGYEASGVMSIAAKNILRSEM